MDHFAGGAQNVDLWTREGFMGASALAARNSYGPDFVSVEGAHAPRLIVLADQETSDSLDPDALPLPVMSSPSGVSLSMSRRNAPMPYAFSNVEADELHFVQAGSALFETLYGNLEAQTGDFVCVPRSVPYRVVPTSEDFLEVIVASPKALRFDTPAPFGVIHHNLSVRRASLAVPSSGDAEAIDTLVIKSFDGITKYKKASNPLKAIEQIGGVAPVWALNITQIHPVSYAGPGGPPAKFLSTPDDELLFYIMSSRSCASRPPIHHNADYDEILYYAAGPGAWGAVSREGTLTHVPKGITHQGPMEDVAEGYLAWLLELRPTLRFTQDVMQTTRLMETGEYGIHPSETK